MNERRPIVKSRRLAGQLRVYATDDALEFDDFAQGELSRRRIFYDDVLLLTRHRSVGWLVIVLTAVIAALFAVPAVALAREDLTTGLTVFALSGGPFVVALVLQAALGTHVVVVWGRRSRVRIPLGFRRGRAAELYEELGRLVRVEQERRAATPR